MARKSDSSANTPDGPDGALKGLREQIDKFDQQILQLINKRAEVAIKIGQIKAEQQGKDMVVFQPAREEEVIGNLLEHNKGPMPEVSIRAIYRELISGCRSLQRSEKVAFLGPEDSFSHLATLLRFGEGVEMVNVGTIAAVFEEVNRGHVQFGVVPLENSTDGRVADTMEMFIRMPQLKICSEVRLRIHHHLLAKCEQSQIRRVYSKPQALSQCRNWLAKNVPHATLHEVSSTANAARLVEQEPFAAAVASRQAAVRYGLQILFNDIEDSPHNETRFAVIGLRDAAKTGRDKTAVMFQIAHSPGALADILMLFKQNKVNLTWIESFPYRQAKGEYVFFVEFEGHVSEPKVKKILPALQDHCYKVSVLGSFPIADPVD